MEEKISFEFDPDELVVDENQLEILPETLIPRRKKPRQKKHFELRKISPLTVKQQKVFDAYENGKYLMLHGYPGTGKTFLCLYLGLKEILTAGSEAFDRIVVIRSVVPSREVGYLPGDIKEKIKIFEEPYKEICDYLFSQGNGYDILKQKGLIEFTTTSYLRGMTFDRTIVIVDEIQNMTFQELDTIMTRLGPDTRISFCGDYRQSDFQEDKDKEGLMKFIRILEKIEAVEHIEFGVHEIVRSGIIKEYLIHKTELGI
jgi:phosphate starvation-inducible protein PhoH and related proteins